MTPEDVYAEAILEDSLEDAESRVIMPIADMLKLQRDSHFLQCLLNAGVDNWDGYDYALDEFTELYSEE